MVVHTKSLPTIAGMTLLTVLAVGRPTDAACPYPVGGQSTIEQWNWIAENIVVLASPDGAGALQNEGLVYMGYVAAAVNDAVVAIEGGSKPYAYRPRTVAQRQAAANASADAAIIEAAYRVLQWHFAGQAATLDTCHREALAPLINGSAKTNGVAVGAAAAAALLSARANDGLQPIGTVSTIEDPFCGPGGYRQTPGTGWALGPQTPWLGDVRPFMLREGGQFGAPPPPRLDSRRWFEQFDEVSRFGSLTSTDRTPEQTAIARFWTANVIRQYNRLGRDLIGARQLPVGEAARLLALINMVAADAQINIFHEKYKFLFWRPVTAIDPMSVMTDWCGTVPGFDDPRDDTVEQTGWRPLINTPNHPEYPGAHGSITSAIAGVLSDVFGTERIAVDIHGFDAGGATGNLDAVRHYETADDLRDEIIDARVWAGLHYRRSTEVAVDLGAKVAHYDLNHGLTPDHGHSPAD